MLSQFKHKTTGAPKGSTDIVTKPVDSPFLSYLTRREIPPPQRMTTQPSRRDNCTPLCRQVRSAIILGNLTKGLGSPNVLSVHTLQFCTYNI